MSVVVCPCGLRRQSCVPRREHCRDHPGPASVPLAQEAGSQTCLARVSLDRRAPAHQDRSVDGCRGLDLVAPRSLPTPGASSGYPNALISRVEGGHACSTLPPLHGLRSACKCPGGGTGRLGSRSPDKPSSPSPAPPRTRPARRHRDTPCTVTLRRCSDPLINSVACSQARSVTAWPASSGEPAATTAHTTRSRRPRFGGPSRL